MTREAAVQSQTTPTNHLLSQGGILQRKCASCGQHKTGGVTCAKCQSNQQVGQTTKVPIIQTKLTVGQPNDKYEQEADRVAERVMRMPTSISAERVSPKFTPPQIQRMCTNCEEEKVQTKEVSGGVPEVTPAVAFRIQSLQGGGQPLSAATRSFFEPRFDQDFSHVRVHTDEQSTRALQARAYTIGRNIVFNPGQYAPDTISGKKLLAHELTHVKQQQSYASQRKRQLDNPMSEREPGQSLQSTLMEQPVSVNEHTTIPFLSRYSDQRTITTADHEVTVDRIVTPGRCHRIPESRSSASGRLAPGGRAVFEASACRGDTAGSVRGELDFSEIIERFGSFISGLPGATSSPDPGRALEDLAESTVGEATTRTNIRFALRLQNFRVELGAGGSTAGSVEGQVSGLLRYTDRQFRIELQGNYEALRTALGSTQDTATLQLGTDFGLVEIRLLGRRVGREEDTRSSEVLGFNGSVGYRLDSEALQLGIDVERTLPQTGSPNTQILFFFGVTTGGRIPAETSPDCYTCRCSEPQIRFFCRRHDRLSDEETGDAPLSAPQPLAVPLFFEYADVVPRSGTERAYQDTVSLIISRLREGYAINRIEGNTSPEGPLTRHPAGQFEGNIQLAENRAIEAQRDIQSNIRAILPLLMRGEARQRLQSALTATYPVVGRSELFGADAAGNEVRNRDLPAYLIGTLPAPTSGQPDPLEQQHVVGSDIPAEILGGVRAEVDAFRSGRRGTRTLSQDERAQALYRVLRRAVVFLTPPPRPPVAIPLPSQIDFDRILGAPITCQEEHRQAFNGTPIPPRELFENRCNER